MLRALPALALCVLLGACGSAVRYGIAGTPRAELAQGTLQIERAEGDLRLLTLVVDQLDAPETQGTDMGHYVVWLGPLPETEDDEVDFERLGALEYDPEAKTGRFSNTTRSRYFVLRITAEASPDAAAPSDLVVAERTVRQARARAVRREENRPPPVSPAGPPPPGPVGVPPLR